MPELIVANLTKRFGLVPAVDDISFTVPDGQFFTLLGPSGCGKSTTLAMMAGLAQPDSGSIRLDDAVFADVGRNIVLPTERRNLGMVFQSYALWPHMTIAENLALPLKLRKLATKQRDHRIDDALDQVGLSGLRERYPHQLSGGQQQRVALARALVYQPRLLLLDEPLSNLDAKLRDRARAWLKDLQKRVGITTIYVTHDQVEALSLSDQIAVLDKGRLLQVGAPREVYERPASPEVAAFLGRSNFFTGSVASTGAGEVRVDLDEPGATLRAASNGAHTPGDRVRIAVRSERLQFVAPRLAQTGDNVLRMKVLAKAYVGARFEYELGFADQVIHAEDQTDLTDDEVRVYVPPEACVVFAAA